MFYNPSVQKQITKWRNIYTSLLHCSNFSVWCPRKGFRFRSYLHSCIYALCLKFSLFLQFAAKLYFPHTWQVMISIGSIIYFLPFIWKEPIKFIIKLVGSNKSCCKIWWSFIIGNFFQFMDIFRYSYYKKGR